MNIHAVAKRAEKDSKITRPVLCEACNEEKVLIRHHRDYDKPLEITWLCYSCHKKEHDANKELKDPNITSKVIQVTGFTHMVVKAEGERQTGELKNDPCRVVSMKEVFHQFAEELNNKHKFIKEK